MAPILFYREYSEAWLPVEIRYFVGWRTADNDKLSLVRHAISFQYLNQFISRYFSLTGITLGYLKRRLAVGQSYAESYFIRNFGWFFLWAAGGPNEVLWAAGGP